MVSRTPYLSNSHRPARLEKKMPAQYVKTVCVYWKSPAARHVLVGHLRRTEEGFKYEYSPLLPDGFLGFPEFPVEKGAFERRQLFSTFSTRIPSPDRQGYKLLLEDWGVENHDDQLEILAKSGGYSLTDMVEFYEERHTLDLPIVFRVAGMKHQKHKSPPPLHKGAKLLLEPERENAWDSFTIKVKLGKATIGYVPIAYSQLIAEELSHGTKIDGHLVCPIAIRDGGKVHWVASFETQA